MTHDTIAAIATALGEGGLAIIRISGPEALAVADRCFQSPGKSPARLATASTHTIHYGHIHNDERRIDEVMASVMRAPRTFTREDVVEISCHGGVLVAREVLAAVLAAGSRLAQPGEFTRRAFLNGRIDLTQAEAILEVIQARTLSSLRAAEEQLEGRLALRINRLRDDLVLVLAHVEAHIDFPDDDIAPDTREALLERLRDGLEYIDSLIEAGHDGQVLRRGIRAAIVGRPNAGKSSLLNLLLGHDRAIVSPIAGTTRDTIEETASIRGIPVVFVDTAGLRETKDEVEREGVRRSEAMLDRAELILHVLDATEELHPEDQVRLTALSVRSRIVVINKIDLPVRLNVLPPWDAVQISCTTGNGLEELKDRIKKTIWTGAVSPEMTEAMINSRHLEALRRTREAVGCAAVSLERDDTLELTAMDLRMAVNAVGEIVGKTSTEDILDAIFTQFCLGK